VVEQVSGANIPACGGDVAHFQRSTNLMNTALFLNGVYESVLLDILASKRKTGKLEHFLQPYKGVIIRMFYKRPPSPKSPVRLYISTTKNLQNICYVAEVIGWADKRQLMKSERQSVLEQIKQFQPGEAALFTAEEKVGEKAVNLLTIRNLTSCATLLPTSVMRKCSDGMPLKPRTRSGGWSEVEDIGDSATLPVESRETYEAKSTEAIQDSVDLSQEARLERLAGASRFPERLQVLATAFRRNSDVVVEVLRRANGRCEKCRNPAPFRKKSDGTPFLEVHHWTPLANGGEDSVENAGALCPNCHREVHFG
jgi:5-methylcytosine-specific restriction enzyme A